MFARGMPRAAVSDGRSWNVIIRLYAPLQPWFDKNWKPGDVERID